jgi:hypothetical protein
MNQHAEMSAVISGMEQDKKEIHCGIGKCPLGYLLRVHQPEEYFNKAIGSLAWILRAIFLEDVQRRHGDPEYAFVSLLRQTNSAVIACDRDSLRYGRTAARYL